MGFPSARALKQHLQTYHAEQSAVTPRTTLRRTRATRVQTTQHLPGESPVLPFTVLKDVRLVSIPVDTSMLTFIARQP
jgi:hypothetical protein